jgi:hypothetical protein
MSTRYDVMGPDGVTSLDEVIFKVVERRVYTMWHKEHLSTLCVLQRGRTPFSILFVPLTNEISTLCMKNNKLLVLYSVIMNAELLYWTTSVIHALKMAMFIT